MRTLAERVPVGITGLPCGGRTVFGASRLCRCIALVIILAGAGCSSTAPRFRPAGATHATEDEVRAEEKIREEESHLDDRRVGTDAYPPPDRVTIMKYSNIVPHGIDRDRVLLDVVAFLGVPYAYGGTDRRGIDCSGFTASVYETALGRKLPRSTREQYLQGVTVDMENIQFGDLVFFNTTGESPSHVGIYIEDDLFAHASVTYGVTISSLESTYYRERIVGVRRIME